MIAAYPHKWADTGRPGHPWFVCEDCQEPRTTENDQEPCPRARELRVIYWPKGGSG